MPGGFQARGRRPTWKRIDVILPSRRFSGYLPAKPPGVQSEPIFLAPSRFLNCCREEWEPIPQRDQLQCSL